MPDKPDTTDKIKWERVEPVARFGRAALWRIPLVSQSRNKLEKVVKGAAWILVHVLAVLGAACGFVLAIAQHHISRSPDMRFHVVRDWHRWWSAFTVAVGSNSHGFTLTFLEPLVALITSFLALLLFVGWKAMKQDKLKASLAAFAITFTVQVLLFGPTFVRKGIDVLYDDHQKLATKNAELVQSIRNLAAKNADLTNRVNSTSQKENGDIRAAKAEAQQAKDDARHWQEAYEKYSHHEQFPDRHLDREDRRRLSEALERFSKEPRNKEYIKIDFGVTNNTEAQHVGFQLYQLFRDSHWNLSKPMELPKDLQDEMQVYGGANASGIFIFTDQPDRGRWLSVMLGRICGQEINVNPRGIPQHYRGLMLWIGNKQFTYWKDDD